MQYLIITLLLISMFLAMMPFIMMFINNLAKVKGKLTFEAQNRTKKSMYIMLPISVALIIIVIILGVSI